MRRPSRAGVHPGEERAGRRGGEGVRIALSRWAGKCNRVGSVCVTSRFALRASSVGVSIKKGSDARLCSNASRARSSSPRVARRSSSCIAPNE